MNSYLSERQALCLATTRALRLPVSLPIAPEFGCSSLAVGRTLVAVLENYQQPDGCIDQFFVSGACAGRGVGGALMAFLLEEARARGVAGLHSHVSLTAQPLFLRHGFRIDARQTVHLRGVAFENARMSLALPRQPGEP